MKVLALAIASDDPEAHLRILRMFHEAFLEIQTRSDQALVRGDHKALREAAHAGNGAAGNIGAGQLSSALKQLELSAADEDVRMIGEHRKHALSLGQDVLRAIEDLEASE